MSEAVLPPPAFPALSEEALAFLTQEMDRLQALYLDALTGAQNVFNFYLTFATAVVGALVVLIQLAPGGTGHEAQTQIVLGAVLFFAAVVGSVYLAALSGKYAHASRFAWGLDELRRYLMERLHVPLPGIYDRFRAVTVPTPDKDTLRLVWLMPTGTYSMFISVMNSACLSGLVWILGNSGGVSTDVKFVAALIVFVLTLTIYNVYSRYTISLFVRRFHVRVDMGSELSIWAARV